MKVKNTPNSLRKILNAVLLLFLCSVIAAALWLQNLGSSIALPTQVSVANTLPPAQLVIVEPTLADPNLEIVRLAITPLLPNIRSLEDAALTPALLIAFDMMPDGTDAARIAITERQIIAASCAIRATGLYPDHNHLFRAKTTPDPDLDGLSVLLYPADITTLCADPANAVLANIATSYASDAFILPTPPPTAFVTNTPYPPVQFTSATEGLNAVFSLTVPIGGHRLSATTSGFLIVKFTITSGQCLVVGSGDTIFNLFDGVASPLPAQTIVVSDTGCTALIETSNASQPWTIEMTPIQRQDPPALTFTSAEYGLQPVIGVFAIPDGTYIVRFTTADFGIVGVASVVGNCGDESMFNISRGQATTGAETIVTTSGDCLALLKIENTTAPWTLEFTAP